jgi:uncharacterized Zn-binding protein involved in type VI secretion
MPGVVREGDYCTGHGCWPPRPSSSWSTDVFTNGLGTVRYSDTMQVHCCPSIPECHGGTHIGTRNVYANGLDVQVIGDPIDCGSYCMEGSDDVFAGDY